MWLESDNDHIPYPFHISTLWLIFLLVLACTGAGLAEAEYYEIIPSVDLTQEYNDNIFVSDNPVDDHITTLASDLALLAIGERLDWNLSGGVRFRKYAENDLQDQQDWHASGGLNYRHSERSSMFTNASFISDTRPDRIVDGFVTRGADRERYDFSIGGRHAATEASTPFFTYRYLEEDFKFLPERNQRTNIVEFGVSQRLDRFLPMTSGQVFFQLSHTDYATSDDDTARFLLGIDKRWKEKWQIHANLGVRYTESTFTTLVPNPSPPPATVSDQSTSQDLGPVTDISLNYTGELTEIKLSASRNVVPASGQGRSVEQIQWIGTVNRRFTEKFRGGLSASIQSQESFKDLNPALVVDRWSILFNPEISYEFNRHWTIDCRYRLFYLNDHERSRDAVQNVVAVTLSFRYPIGN